MSKHLLFKSEEQMQNYFASNGLSVGKRVSKSAKEEIFTVKEGQLAKERW